MIGASLRRGVMAAAVACGFMAGMPNLGQQRTLGIRPGSGIVRRTGPAPRRRDATRQAAAQAKRDRKDAKRARDAQRAANGQECARWCAGRGCHGF